MSADAPVIVQALQALARSSAARTKTARLRELLPEIEAAQTAGVKHEYILDALNAHGFELSMKSYSVMLWRLRQQQAKSGITSLPPAAAQMPGPMASAATHNATASDGSTPAAGQTAPRPGDPQRFDWNALKNIPPEW